MRDEFPFRRGLLLVELAPVGAAEDPANPLQVLAFTERTHVRVDRTTALGTTLNAGLEAQLVIAVQPRGPDLCFFPGVASFDAPGQLAVRGAPVRQVTLPAVEVFAVKQGLELWRGTFGV